MFKLDKIQNRISNFFTEVRKAEDPAAESMPENADSGADKEEILAGEITALLDDGTISPETEKVKNWAVSKGLSEDAAEGFANDVISAYFSDDEDDSEQPQEDNDMAEEEVKENEDKEGAEGDEDEEDDEVTKAALAQLARMDEDSRLIMKGMTDLTDAINKIADKVNGIEKQVNDELIVVKSQLGNVKSTPANAKSPVTQTQAAPSADQIQIPVVKSWIKEQFAAGNPDRIQINDVAALDSGYISPKIKDLYLKSRGNK